jgi:hypothetical protein
MRRRSRSSSPRFAILCSRADPRAIARRAAWKTPGDGYCALGAPIPVSVALSLEPSGSVTEPPLADNEPSRAR